MCAKGREKRHVVLNGGMLINRLIEYQLLHT